MLTRLREDIRQIRRLDASNPSTLAVLLCFPGLHAVTLHRVSHWLWCHRCYLPGRLLSHVTRCLTDIDIHPAALIGRRCFIDHGTGVVIGETAQVGDDVIIYQGVTLGARHTCAGKRHPTVEDGVLLGAGAKILGPVTVRRGAKIGCNAVVLRDVPAFATAVGVPARIIQPHGRKRDTRVSAETLVR